MDLNTTMLNNFRDHHPMGSIITELIRIEEGIHFVRAQVVVNSTILGTGMAGSHTVEDAEDAALKRALVHAGFSRTSSTGSSSWSSSGYSSYDGLSNEVTFESSGGSANGHRLHNTWDPLPTPSPPLSSSPPSAGLGSAELMDEEDLSDVIAQTDVEMKRVGWSSNQGRDYLIKTFGKRSRQLLEPQELMQFLRYLQQQPTRS